MIAGHCTYGVRMLNDAIGIVADQIAALDRAISAAKQLPVHPVRKPPSRRVFAFLRLTQLHALARFPQTMHSPAPSLFAESRRTRVGVFDSRLALIRAAVIDAELGVLGGIAPCLLPKLAARLRVSELDAELLRRGDDFV